MSDWSDNNLSCISTWLGLRILEQNKKTFPKSGDLTMRSLAFWNSSTTLEMRARQARTIAKQLDNLFRLVDGAEYEDGVTSARAVGDMARILTDGQQTMADLASANDDNYRFFGELI
jgi:hypothetical protein